MAGNMAINTAGRRPPLSEARAGSPFQHSSQPTGSDVRREAQNEAPSLVHASHL